MSKRSKSSLDLASSSSPNIKQNLAGSSSQPTSTRIPSSGAKKRKVEVEYSLMLSDSDLENAYLMDDEAFRCWSLHEKVSSDKYSASFVEFLDAKEFNYQYIKSNGFDAPLVFQDKTGLGLRVPSENFKVSDVKSCVGSKRIIDVMDVNTQQALTMTMKDWCEYYENPARDRLLNVISLEFSHTKLENYVEAPLVVRQLDWIETAWPQHLRMAQAESTNLIEKMKYPKVQKYVLMSVADCYTDFHVDMGGTSVWYHILKGEKVFWLIPPTEANLKTYERWVMSGNQANTFLPDIVESCQRIVLKQGWTFMLPSGWIHAVYTSQDSLVFGGNFLHSFNIPMQLRIYNLESKTKVPAKYRYPFYTEMLWFLIERYVHCFTGTTYLDNGVIDNTNQQVHQPYKTFEPSNFSLSSYERRGLQAVWEFFKNLTENRWNVPKEIIQHESLFNNIKYILDNYDTTQKLLKTRMNQEKDSTVLDSSPFLHWPKADKKFVKKMVLANKLKKDKLVAKQQTSFDDSGIASEASFNLTEELPGDSKESPILTKALKINAQYKAEPKVSKELKNLTIDMSMASPSGTGSNNESRKHIMRNLPRTKGSIKKRLRPQNVPRSNVERRRRVRCHSCEPCTRGDCGECKYCKDMKKFGGTGISKQCCLSKQCFQPLLPTTTTCMLCEKLINRKDDGSNIMYECEICFEIYHAQCFRRQYSDIPHIDCLINEDLNNCWQCANCVNKGYMKAENFSSSSTKGDSILPHNISFEANGYDSLNGSFTSNKKDNGSQINSDLLHEYKLNCMGKHQIQQLQTKPTKKRHRRTKLEIEHSKRLEMEMTQRNSALERPDLYEFADEQIQKSNRQSMSMPDSFPVFNTITNCQIPAHQQQKHSVEREFNTYRLNYTSSGIKYCNGAYANNSMISVDSLSNYEKQIILNEFCEICQNTTESFEDGKEATGYTVEDRYEIYEESKRSYYGDYGHTANLEAPKNPNYIRNQSANYDYPSDQELYMLNECSDTQYNYNYDENKDEEDDDNDLYSDTIESETNEFRIADQSNEYTFDNSSLNNNYSTSTQNSFESLIFKVDHNNNTNENSHNSGDFCLIESEDGEELFYDEDIAMQYQQMGDYSHAVSQLRKPFNKI